MSQTAGHREVSGTISNFFQACYTFITSSREPSMTSPA